MKVVVIVVNGQARQYVSDLDVARLRVNSAILGAGLKETLWPDSHTNQVRESRQARATIIELREVTVERDFYMGPNRSIATSEWHIADLQDIFMKPVLPVSQEDRVMQLIRRELISQEDRVSQDRLGEFIRQECL